MPFNTQVSNVAAAAEANAFAKLLNGGFIDIYDGVQPATAETAITGQIKGVRLTFGSPAFGASTDGTLTSNAITPGTATARIVATWFRCLKADGVTVVMDGTVSTSSANLVLPAVLIDSGVVVSCSSFTHTVNRAASGL